MLQSMAFGGYLGESLFSNVRLSLAKKQLSITFLSNLAGHRSISLSTTAIWLCRLCSIAVLLCICFSCRLFWTTCFTPKQRQRVNFLMPHRQGHRNAAECQCDHLRILTLWDLGLSACHRWRFRSAIAESAATEEASQR